jgi:hypothetical protein
MRLCVYSLGVRSTRFVGPACAEPRAGPDVGTSKPRGESGGGVSIEAASRSPLGERSARAFRLAIPWHDPATCGAAAMPRSHHAMANLMSVSTRSRDSSPRLLRIRGPSLSLRLAAACAPSASEPRVTWLPRLPSSAVAEDGSSQTASVFLHHPRAPPCFTARPSRSPLRPRPGTKRARCSERLGGV